MSKNMSKVFGALLGVAVGDALGAPLEFMTAEEIRKKHSGAVREMIGGGWLNVAPGEITDDTQMTLAVAEGIAESPRDPIPAIGRRFIEWYDSRPKDIGNCCRAAIAYAKADGAVDFHGWCSAAQRVHEDTGGHTAGNGALMRTVYPSLYYNDKKKRSEITTSISKMTHWAPQNIEACHIYTEIVSQFIRDSSIKAAHDFVGNTIYQKSKKSSIELNPTGYVVDSLLCALACLFRNDNFADTVIDAVNLGGDADTIGAITGGLAGALYGAEAIPQRWTDALDGDLRRHLTHLAEQAYKRTE